MMEKTVRQKLDLPETCSSEDIKKICTDYYFTYSAVCNSTRNPEVKRIAESRLNDLVESAKKEDIILLDDFGSICETADFSCSESNIELELCKLMTSPDDVIIPAEVERLREMVESLPESPKKYYFFACLIRISYANTVEDYESIIENLKKAMELDSQNPVYREMAELVNEEVVAFRRDLDAYHEQAERENRKKRNITMVKRIFSTIGEGILTVLGAIVGIIGYGISLCIDCCFSC